MIRRTTSAVFIGILALFTAISAEAVIKVEELEMQYGAFQGHMEMGKQTVLLFASAKVKVSHITGEATVELVEVREVSAVSRQPAMPDIRTIKRKIDRLPAYEQVRYWKLHQIRYPNSDVDAELNAALDLVESLRREAIDDRLERDAEQRVARRSYPRYRPSSLFYYPSYGYSSAYRYRRSLRRDTQIELDRIYQPPRAESWDTAMSMADRGRAEALSHVEGGRSAILGNTR